MSRLLRWWRTGSPSWRHLVLSGTMFALALAIAVVCLAAGSGWGALAAVVVAALTALAGVAELSRARISGERILSPHWYQHFVEQAEAERATRPGHPGEGR